jgi:hypothetical protein
MLSFLTILTHFCLCLFSSLLSSIFEKQRDQKYDEPKILIKPDDNGRPLR